MSEDANIASELIRTITPRTPQTTAVGIINALRDSRAQNVGNVLLEQMDRFTPATRAAGLRVMLARPETTETLLTAVADNRVAREAMMLAATQGGIAFANASVTLIHGMSRPIGAQYHVPHGLSNAMLLPEITAWSVQGAPGRYAEAARAMGLSDTGDAEAVALEKLVSGLRQLNADLSVPGPGAWGIYERDWFESMPLMAEQALASGSPANNPIVPDAAEIVGLYEKVWRAG